MQVMLNRYFYDIRKEIFLHHGMLDKMLFKKLCNLNIYNLKKYIHFVENNVSVGFLTD